MDYQVINKYRLLAIGNNYCLSYRKGILYVHKRPEDKPIFLLRLPGFLSFFAADLLERFFRIAPRCAIAVEEDGFLVSFRGGIYLVNARLKTIVREHSYRRGMNHPLSFCKIENIPGFEDSIAYGEYWGNLGCEEVAIYCRRQFGWEKAVSFGSGQVQHIHGLFADPHRQQVLILTGDTDQESGIWSAKEQFRILSPFLQGSQSARACVLFPLREGLLYATDTPLQQNVLFFAREEEGTWNFEKVMELPGPAIFGTRYNDETGEERFALATSVEPDPQVGGLKYLITRRLAKGVKDRNSYIIAGNLQKGFQILCSFRKDHWPMLLFQFGNVLFPSGEVPGQLYFCPQSVVTYHGKTLKWI